jgi:hypothetical protein
VLLVDFDRELLVLLRSEILIARLRDEEFKEIVLHQFVHLQREEHDMTGQDRTRTIRVSTMVIQLRGVDCHAARRVGDGTVG